MTVMICYDIFSVMIQYYRVIIRDNIDFPNTLIFNVFSILLQVLTSKVFQGGKLLDGHEIFRKLDIKMSQCNDEKDIWLESTRK